MPAVEAGAELYAAGKNERGQCGADPEATGTEFRQPAPVSGLGALAGAAVQQIAQGWKCTLLLIQGRLYHAGSNGRGQRGNGRRDNDPHPDFAEIPLRARAVEVACAGLFALVLLENGTLMSWGSNRNKQLGRGGDENAPRPVEGLGKVRHVYAGYDFAFVLLAGGEVRAWGNNSSGQLCLGRTGAAKGSPQRVRDLCGMAAAIALSCRAGIALLTDDSAVAWGNLRGNLADGTGRWDAKRGCVPLRLRLTAVRAVGAGGYFLCAHLQDDRLVSWGGSISVACLGRDGPAHLPTPVRFPGGGPITDFFCLYYCLFAKGPSGWAACGNGPYGLPFGESGEVGRLTLIPRPWVPCPRQGGQGAECAFYVRAAGESEEEEEQEEKEEEEDDDAGRPALGELNGAADNAFSRQPTHGRKPPAAAGRFTYPGALPAGCDEGARVICGSVEEEDREVDERLGMGKYAMQIHRTLRRKEEMPSVQPNPCYMQFQDQITDKMRAILIDWLVSVQMKFRLLAETLHLTVNLIDRYLSRVIIKRSQLQLVGVVAMLIASRYEEIVPPEVEMFVHISANTYLAEDIFRMQRHMLMMLDWRVANATTCAFLCPYIKFAQFGVEDSIVQGHLEHVSHMVCDSALMRMQNHKPSKIAAASVCAARQMLGLPAWTGPLSRRTGYYEQPLRRLAADLILQCARTVNPNVKLPAILKKYTLPQHSEVANPEKVKLVYPSALPR